MVCWWRGLLVGVWLSSPRPSQEPLCFLICLTLLVQAGNRSPRMRGLPRGRRGPLTCGFAAERRSWRGMRCRRRASWRCSAAGGDGPGRGPPGRQGAGRWLPDFVRLGELERHLGDGAIEAATAAALEAGRRERRERRRIMSYPLVIRLILAMALLTGMTVCAAAVSGSHPCLASTLPARGPAAGPAAGEDAHDLPVAAAAGGARARRLRGQVAGGGMVPAGMNACQVTRIAMASSRRAP
jgi:hypothetical protein